MNEIENDKNIIYAVYDSYTSSKRILEYFTTKEKAEKYIKESFNWSLKINEIEVK